MATEKISQLDTASTLSSPAYLPLVQDSHTYKINVQTLAALLGGSGGGGGTTDHAQLTNRDAAGQHPISAVTGLAEALTAIQEPVDLSGYVTTDALIAALSPYATTTRLEATVNTVTSAIAENAQTYTDAAIAAAIAAAKANLNAYVDAVIGDINTVLSSINGGAQ